MTTLPANLSSRYDVVIIGSGVGGMCSAALLANAGYRVLVAEKLQLLGGRFSTHRFKDDYLLNTGGNVYCSNRYFYQVLQEVGLPQAPLLEPEIPLKYRFGGRDVIMPQRGGLKTIIREMARSAEEAERVTSMVYDALQGNEPPDNLTLEEWIAQCTDNQLIRGFFWAIAANLSSAGANEMPAGTAIHTMKNSPSFPYGWVKGGVITLHHMLASAIEGRGGAIVKGAKAVEITASNGRVDGVVFDVEGRSVEVQAQVVISNIPPRDTVALVGEDRFAPEYLAEMRRTLRPAAGMEVIFVSEKKLFDFDGCICFLPMVETRRLGQIEMMNQLDRSLSPPGVYYYLTLQIVEPGSHENVDRELERRLVLEDLREQVPEFERECEVLTVRLYHKSRPIMNTIPGFVIDPQSPLPNLFFCGDASVPRGFSGSDGCARNAQIVAGLIKERFAPAA
ncbi:MAG: NAD(P)/FAD-dependent oxidoreductase [Candidatus Tectomicrobia bacterium]|nr:NAD(P)/FAD-dependent oxidoreductase [Candidatus Tectomicrobia bacterium]